MIPERMIHLMDRYQQDLAPYGDGLVESAKFTHVYNMCTRIRQLINAGDMDKAHTWLGFIQCFLWTNGLYALDELKAHNDWQDAENEPGQVFADPRDVYKVEGPSS